MSWFGRFHGKNNHELVHYLKDSKIIKSDRVVRAMQSVDRGNYTSIGQAYVDAPQGIGHGVTISAPHMHGYALQLLEDKLQDGGRALDVGSGSGYLTACFAMMLGPQGLAIGIDHIPELKEAAVKNITKDNPDLLESGRVKLVVGDGRLGYPEGGPYDAIHVGAAAKETPQALIDQLAPGGRMLVPVGAENSDQTLVQFDKLQDGRIKRKSLMGVVYVPLTDKERQDPSWK
ncbi:protein-L-isoaspartate(D-aspartate) O-methyltransferase isoform X1 [Athalia rosae]|uniref:protein-L-isoaspartate(D-aspartate) O-methyltransferase isoform X1 n=2 Tax=Athalia rosae TaxID=37344 RepID=UPI0006256DEE|nr:protein-L-isoaspartate(D-aspartate) O-methyltransferase isoform X1 [Athalia rosae]XP_048505488.1 protein-L-isoaspartate(D-aspartate) O-methyltransferase isoform X1 [Athalia rosae]